VLGDASLRDQLAEGGQRAARRATWDSVVETQLAIYREALDPSLC
jgi:hypothetical protein